MFFMHECSTRQCHQLIQLEVDYRRVVLLKMVSWERLPRWRYSGERSMNMGGKRKQRTKRPNCIRIVLSYNKHIGRLSKVDVRPAPTQKRRRTRSGVVLILRRKHHKSLQLAAQCRRCRFMPDMYRSGRFLLHRRMRRNAILQSRVFQQSLHPRVPKKKWN